MGRGVFLNKIKVETDFFDDNNIKSKKFIWDLLDQETQVKNQNIKVYEFIKNNPKIDITPKTLKTIHDCGNVVKWAIEPVQNRKKFYIQKVVNQDIVLGVRE